ncbi:YveK family protein [Allobacillus sp. GCM10007491]|uniref:Capsular biosynthesis protein n=1 Tax=Allobacillus saliphilus TaxID=2912308 RepID=A0A941CSR3_9BACI|nr:MULTISPECIES: Wzz/FepE/Etk N-terminal domain-containing protein [Allobacillus]MBR7552539.1 capsular biosynthesis protein [Allobacillus saliphilus]TSJ62539.1 capsular biosynthesis protein [Allobacillus sp. SKP2-8]
MEETISLQEIFQVIKKRMKLIIAITVAAVLVSALITLFILTPKYEASSQFIVSQSEPTQEVNINDIRTNVEMINTYNVIITSPAIMDQVIEELDLNLSNGALASKISVANAQNSQVVNVTATDTDPAVAANIANTTVEVFKESVPTYMNVDNVSILSAAVVGDNPAPVSPNVTLNIAIAFVLGVMVGVGLAFLLEYLDTTIKTEEDIEKLLELPVMGVVPTMDANTITDPSRTARGRGAKHGA